LDDVSLAHDGSIYWNGARISSARFGEYLKETHTMNPEPTVFLETEMGVSCSALEAVRDQMDQALECKKAYSSCAEGIQRVWRDLPMSPGSAVS
jgi:hypothetical protein